MCRLDSIHFLLAGGFGGLGVSAFVDGLVDAFFEDLLVEAAAAGCNAMWHANTAQVATAAIAAHRLRTCARRARALATRASKLGHLAATTRATPLGALAILALGPAAEPNFAPRPLASTIDVVASVAVASLAIEAKDATRWSEAATEPDWEAPDPFFGFYHHGFPHVPKSVRR